MITTFTVNAEGSGTINFSGRISAVTCNASVNGGGNNATISLPTVQASVLAVAGDHAGQTGFNVSITGCRAAGTVRAYFEQGATVDSVSGRLNNTATSGAASSVQLELLDGTQNYSPLFVGNSNQNDGGFVRIAGESIVLPYAVRYYATGAAGAGAVTSSVTYSVIYK